MVGLSEEVGNNSIPKEKESNASYYEGALRWPATSHFSFC